MRIKEIFKLFLLFGLVSANQNVFCQCEMQEVIILNNGNKLKGYIVYKDSIYIKLLTSGDKVSMIKINEILYTEKQAPGNITLFNERRFKSSGFQSQAEGMNGFGSYSRAVTGIRFINGYKFKNKQFIGLGIGGTIHHGSFSTDIYFDNHKSYPVFLRYSFDYWAKKSTPYVFADVGTPLENPKAVKMLKPLTLRVGIGNKIIFKRNIFYFALGYTYNKSRNAYQHWSPSGYVTTGYSNWYNSHTAEISFGFQFN